MEVSVCPVQLVKGGPDPQQRGSVSSTPNFSTKLICKQQRNPEQFAVQHAPVTLEYGESAVLPRPSSFEAQSNVQYQVFHQPQMMKVQARAYSQRPSASFSISSGTHPPGHPAPMEGVPADGSGLRNTSGKEGWNQTKKSSFGGATKKQVYRQLQGLDRSDRANGGDGDEQRVNYSSGARRGRTRPRPSSARHPPSRAPIVYRKVAANGSIDGRGDPAQASFFPLLSADDEAHANDRPTPHTGNIGTRLSLSGSEGREAETAPAASAARPTAGMAIVAAAPAGTTSAPKAKAVSSPRPFQAKPQRHRERVVSQPLRAHPTSFSPKSASGGDSGKRGLEGSTAVATSVAGVGTPAGVAPFATGGSQQLTPQSPARATEGGATLAVSYAPPVSNPPTNCSAVPSSSSSSTWSVAGGGVATADGSSRVHGSHGHHSDHCLTDHHVYHPGAHCHSLAHQLSRSGTVSAGSSPRMSSASSSSGMGQGAGGSGESAGYGRLGSGGGIAPPHGGQTLRRGASPVREGNGLGIGNRSSRNSSRSSDTQTTKTREISRNDAAGGRNGGRPHGQGATIEEPKEFTNSSCSRGSVGISANSSFAGKNAPAGYGGIAIAPPASTELVPKRGPFSATAVVPAAVSDGTEGGVLLPGPDGAIEVREIAGGVLVVRRNADEKTRSPERLNLHRRRLKSCPVIQGDTRLRLLNYQNNLISKIANLANLPSLIFIDLYNNLIDTMEGTLATMTTLRVMMIGKNKIDKISNLGSLRKLDVLDLHSNSIRKMEGLDSLQDLRVLNLAGNEIRVVENVSSLTALTELNLRRNIIEKVTGLDALPRLQRLFLSNNKIGNFHDCFCVFSARSLQELSLDGNPVADQNGLGSNYRRYVLHHLPSLRHLDLKRVTDHDHNQPGAFSQLQHPQHSYSGGDEPRLLPKSATTVSRARENNRHDGGDGGGNNVSGSSRSRVQGPPELDRLGATKHIGRPSTTDGTQAGDSNSNESNSNGSSQGHSNTSISSRAQEQQRQRWASAKDVRSGRSSDQGFICRDGAETPARSNGMSRASEAREAVAAKRIKTEREERERTALKERREAIEAARECWERRGRGQGTPRPRYRSARHRTNKGVTGDSENTGVAGVGVASGPSPCPSPRSPIPPEGRRTSSAGHASSGNAAGSGAGCLAAKKASGNGDVEGVVTTGRPSRDTTGEGGGGDGGGRGRRGGAGVSGGVGYFELEQRISRINGNGCGHGDGNGRSGEDSGTGDGAGSETAGVTPAEGRERSSRSRQGSGSSITLKVYGDVWRWMGDDKVCGLREKVVEARFSLVHVTSVARKANAIAQTFPNLSCLQMLDNDIRSLKQLEHLRPLLGGLRTLHLGRKNPLTKNASVVALRAWVKAQGRGPTSNLSLEISPSTARGEEDHALRNGRGGSSRHPQQQRQPSTEGTRSRQSISSPSVGALNAVLAPPPPQPPPTAAAAAAVVAPRPCPPYGTDIIDDSCANNDESIRSNNSERGTGDENRGSGGGSRSGGTENDHRRPSHPLDSGCDTDLVGAAAGGSGAGGGTCVATEQRHAGGVLPGEVFRDQALAAAAAGSGTPTASSALFGGRSKSNREERFSTSAALPTPTISTAAAAADAAFERLSAAQDRAMSSSWGGIALCHGSESTCPRVQSAWDVARDSAGGGNAWAASSRGAKLACNLMVRRVCEAHKRKENFGVAWETTLANIIQGVLAPGTTAGTATITTTGVFGGGESAAPCSRSPRDGKPPPLRTRHAADVFEGGLRPRAPEDQTAGQKHGNQREEGVNGDGAGGRADGGVGVVWTSTPRARWLDEW